MGKRLPTRVSSPTVWTDSRLLSQLNHPRTFFTAATKKGDSDKRQQLVAEIELGLASDARSDWFQIKRMGINKMTHYVSKMVEAILWLCKTWDGPVRRNVSTISENTKNKTNTGKKLKNTKKADRNLESLRSEPKQTFFQSSKKNPNFLTENRLHTNKYPRSRNKIGGNKDQDTFTSSFKNCGCFQSTKSDPITYKTNKLEPRSIGG